MYYLRCTKYYVVITIDYILYKIQKCTIHTVLHYPILSFAVLYSILLSAAILNHAMLYYTLLRAAIPMKRQHTKLYYVMLYFCSWWRLFKQHHIFMELRLQGR